MSPNPILIIELLGLLYTPFSPGLPHQRKDKNMATANENINENIVAVEDLKI